METLLLQRFNILQFRANNISIANLQSIFPVGGGLRFQKFYPLLKDSDLFDAVEVVENDSPVAANDHHFPHFVRISPAHMDMTKTVVLVAQSDESNIFVTVAYYPGPNSTGPNGRLVH